MEASTTASAAEPTVEHPRHSLQCPTMSLITEHPPQRPSDDDDWIDSATALKIVIQRLADPIEAERRLDDLAKLGTLTACCRVMVEDWDWGPVPASPPTEIGNTIADIRRASPGRVIRLGGAFWQSHLSGFEAQLWQWQRGIFIHVPARVPILKASHEGHFPMVPAHKRLVAYQVQFMRDEINAFASKLTAFALKAKVASAKLPTKRVKWSWAEAEACVQKAIGKGVVDGKWWSPNMYGALARVEAELAKALIDLKQEGVSDSTIKRHAREIFSRSPISPTRSEPS
jgi:hypothetical protein